MQGDLKKTLMPLITESDAHNITSEIFAKLGASPEEARIAADHLVEASLCGVDSHGMMRIPQYVEDIQNGTIIPGANIRILDETPVSAVVDCAWNFGMVGAHWAGEIALKKARDSRIAVVVTQRCNHAGRLGHYMKQIGDAGFIGLGFCSSPKQGHFVVPWGGLDGRLSTNPLAYAFPMNGRGPIVADFSTSVAPEGRIRLYRNRKQNLPEGWILDASGEPSTSPADFYGPPKGRILPFGGKQGYRGYALGLLVEVMATLLAGQDSTKPRVGNGVSFIVLDPALVVDPSVFNANTAALADYMKSSRPAKGHTKVQLPGEPEEAKRRERREHGIPIEETTWSAVVKIAASLEITLPVYAETP
jgi:hydroxycarboxylate dehydrogenase B